MEAIRHSFTSPDMDSITAKPEYPPAPLMIPQILGAQRPTTPPPPRLSRAPVFNSIHEVVSSEEEREYDDDPRHLQRPLSALSIINGSRLPRPASAHSESPNPWLRRAGRRQSGLIERPPSPSPGSPVAERMKSIGIGIEEE